jgi:hypothetical protein
LRLSTIFVRVGDPPILDQALMATRAISGRTNRADRMIARGIVHDDVDAVAFLGIGCSDLLPMMAFMSSLGRIDTAACHIV